MHKKMCRCGKQTKNFKFDIGPFFITECCTKAGYDHLGNRKEVKPEDLGLTSTDAEEIREAKLVEDPDELAELEKLETVQETEVVADFDGNIISQKDVKPEKKKRSYNRGGNIKKES